jgi:hypothetical protein
LFILAAPLASHAADDPCQSFYDIKEVKAEDTKGHAAIPAYSKAKNSLNNYATTCASLKTDPTKINSDATIAAVRSQSAGAVSDGHDARVALTDARKAALDAIDAMSDDAVQKRAGADGCVKSLQGDLATFKKGLQNLDTLEGNVAKCLPGSGPTPLHPNCPIGVTCRGM